LSLSPSPPLSTLFPYTTLFRSTLTLGCSPTANAIDSALGHATATDACGPVTPTPTTGTVTVTGCQRSQTRTWTASDACGNVAARSEEHTSELQSLRHLVCRLLL